MTQRSKIPRRWKFALAFLAAVLVVLVVAVAWVVIWVQSETGQTWLAKVVSRVASSETMQVRLQKLLVTPGGLIRLESFEISDADGVWMRGKNLEAGLDAFELIHKKLLIDYARVESVNMTRVPKGGPPKTERQPFQLSIPPLPYIEAHNVEVKRAEIGPGVIGDAQVLHLTAYADLGGDAYLAVIEADRLEGPEGHARIRAELDGSPQKVGLTVSVKEAPGGIIPKAMGSPSSEFTAEMTGRGPVDRFGGHIKITASDAGEVDADFRVQQEKAIAIDLAGEGSIRPEIVPAQLKPLVQEPSRFSLRFVSSDTGLAVESFVIDSPLVKLEGGAKADSGFERITGDFNLEILETLPSVMLNGVALEAGSRIAGNLTEAEGKHTLAVTADLPKVDFKGMTVQAANLEARVTNSGGLKKPLAGLEGSGDLRVSVLRLSKDQPPLEDIQTRFRMDMPSSDLLNIQSLEVLSPWLRSEIKGQINLAAMTVDLNADTTIAEIGKAPVQTGLTGAFQLSSEVQGNLTAPDLTITTGGEWSGLGGIPAEVKRLTGDRLTLSAKVNLKESLLRFQDVAITGLSKLTADGRVDLGKSSFETAFRVTLPEKVEFALASPLKVSGPTVVQGHLSGPFNGFELNVQADASQVESNGQVLSSPKVRVQMAGLPSRIKGRGDAEASTPGGPMTASGNFQMAETSIQVSDVQVKAPGAHVEASATVNRKTGLTNGQADFAIQDLGLIGMFTGMEMRGSAKGSAVLKTSQNVQLADIDLEADNLVVSGSRAKRLTVKAQNLAVSGTPSGQARLDALGLETGGLRFQTVGLNLQGRNNGVLINGRASGKWNRPLNLSFEALVEKPGAATILTLNQFTGKIGRFGFNQNQTLRASYSSTEMTMQNLDLTIGKGRIRGNGKLTGKEVQTEINVAGLPLGMASLFSDIGLSGAIDGRIHITGPVGSPTAGADLQLKGVRPAGPDYKTVPPLSGAVNLNLARGNLTGSADISGLSQTPGRAEFSLPMRLSVKPFQASILQDEAIAGNVSAKVDLSLLPVLLALDNQSLTGSAQADLKISGRMKNPQISGQVTVADGRYENVRVGALFDRINAEITATGSKMEITRFTATDGEGGQIQAKGKIDVEPEGRFPYQLALNFQGAKLVRLDILTARCWGDLNLKGNSTGADLAGSVKMDPIELNIPERSGPDVPNLQIKEVNAPASETPEPEKKSGGYRLNLDIGLDMPGRAFVRGRGLDSEWQGKLKIQGTSEDPRVRGRLNLVRGKFDFLGRTFRLTEGTLTFSGNSPPLPFLNVTGEATAGEITAIVNITGPATLPKVELSSTPTLPQDEILSRVLFGRNLNAISAIQALRLAQAARQLAGGGGPNLDITGKARETLHLDELDIGQTDEGGSTVGVGKYINEDIYVRAEKDLTPGDGKVTVEIEIGPSFSIETQTGGASGGKFGANWKKDY